MLPDWICELKHTASSADYREKYRKEHRISSEIAQLPVTEGVPHPVAEKYDFVVVVVEGH